MARAYDIAERLQNANKKSTLTIDKEHTYNINTSKNSAILMQAIGNDETLNEVEKLDKLIEAGIGKDALEYINSLELTLDATTVIINAIMAAVADTTIEEIEKEAEKEAKKFRR